MATPMMRQPRAMSRECNRYERVASPARDFLSVGGLFAMDDDFAREPPPPPCEEMAVSRPQQRPTSSPHATRKPRGVKHLKEIPAGALPEVLGAEQSTASTVELLARVYSASSERMAESRTSGTSSASGETAVDMGELAQPLTCGACACIECADGTAEMAYDLEPSLPPQSARALFRLPNRVCPCCVCCGDARYLL
ncbi:hypothetical protein AB1Y20_014056 [Prymnesium parvum]|uniref:Phospholipid scramblase n=1 Tax=Prymnesium parvum TaxID=97485 RepID=A0AB34IIL8_PRYPA